MHAFGILSLAGVYGLYAVGICVCCGLLTRKLLKREHADTPTPPSARLVVSDFLLGCGFGPWCIGLIQLAFLIVFSELPPLFIAGCALATMGIGLYALRGEAGEVFRSCRELVWRDGFHRLGALLVLAAVAVVAAFCLRAAAIPLWHGDTLIYAYEAKALYDENNYTARLGHTPEPNARNYIRKNDHPLTYIGDMASGLYFSPERGQDLSMRLALQVQNVLLLIALAGLGLRLGGTIGVLAPILLLFAQYFGALIDMSHREAFRIIPALLCFGFLPEAGKRLRLTSGRAALLFASMLFLWNAHSGSIVVAPLVVACQFLVLRDWRARGLVTAMFLIGFLLGANHLLASYYHTGNPLGFEFAPQASRLTHIATPQRWHPTNPPAPGLASLGQRLRNQCGGDGTVGVAMVFFGLGAVAWLLARRRRLSPVVLAAALFCLVNEMEVLGLLDWVSTSFGGGLYTVARYRFVLYPFAALLTAFALAGLVKRLRLPLATALGVALLAGGTASAMQYWQRTPLAPNLVRDASILMRLDPVKSCWGAVAAHLPETDPARPVILTDATMIPWYYTDWQVLNIYDPRLEKARLTRSPEEALAELDHLRVGAVILNKAKFLSGTAIEAALLGPAYEKFVDCIYDEGYRRVPTQP